jgi:predicted DNA-binding transcriptional regulator YafY
MRRPVRHDDGLTVGLGRRTRAAATSARLRYRRGVGQRSATETLFRIIAAFIEKRTWSQADLARKLETRPETIRKHLNELVAGGFQLEQERDHPHVYWSVPKTWFPGALVFKPDEVVDLLRLLGRARRGKLREEVLGLVVSRLSNLGHTSQSFDPNAVRAPEVDEDEERWLSLVEDAAAQRVALKMRYFVASRRQESWRHVSVHRVDLGPRPHFIATCHVASALRRFRVSGISDARLDRGESFRRVTTEELARFDGESLGGYRHDGPVVSCAFFVRDEEAAWVARNLPDGKVTQERRKDGVAFHVETTAVTLLARFVVGLGEAARPETPLLAEEVSRIARGSLTNADSARST